MLQHSSDAEQMYERGELSHQFHIQWNSWWLSLDLEAFPFPCAPAGALTVATLEKPAHPAQRSTINSTGSAGKRFVLGHQICLPTRGLEEGDYRASSLPSKQLGYSSGTQAANLRTKPALLIPVGKSPAAAAEAALAVLAAEQGLVCTLTSFCWVPPGLGKTCGVLE